ncbi:MAG: tetratricopeptide repeat protein [Prevotellaceae bacterium]|jgi:tetratricopeptide (TPR) repeat protein|nr:tetratricopeptide repeat protein [Prevotellaceae bacterium]
MKKTILILLIAAFSSQLSAQDCSQDENFVRFMTRGKAALKAAQKLEDYKLAAGEFKKALEYDAKCADIYEQLAVCYEQMGELDPGNYRQAINYLNTYLSLRPDAPNKQEIQEKVYELEFLLEKAGGISLDNLIGKWKFYLENGGDASLFDIEIHKEQDNYYATHVFLERWFADKNNWSTLGDFKNLEQTNRTCKINYEDGVIIFWTLHNKSRVLKNGREITLSRREFYYELHLDKNVLRGISKCSLNFEGMGNSKYRNVLEAVEAGRGTVLNDCEGDCGDNKVYFVKQ